MSSVVFVAVHLLAPWAQNVVPEHEDRPTVHAAERHNRWFTEMTNAGWRYGFLLDPDRKTHPDLMPYSSLTPRQQSAVSAAFAADLQQSHAP
ncbi:MAG: RyR domain [Gemmatimonadetes bacterium]|nr:RyR domain [Gemmatimonadota bacterium]